MTNVNWLRDFPSGRKLGFVPAYSRAVNAGGAPGSTSIRGVGGSDPSARAGARAWVWSGNAPAPLKERSQLVVRRIPIRAKVAGALAVPLVALTVATGIGVSTNARHADDPAPLDPGCACPACRDHSRAYLHHLVRCNEILGAMLLTWHNLHLYQQLIAEIRAAIAQGTFAAWQAAFAAGLTPPADCP